MTTDYDEREWEQERAEFVADLVTDGLAAASPLVLQFAELTKALLSADTVAGVLNEVVAATRAVIPGADFVSVTLRDSDGSYHTPVSTDPLADELDVAQYRSEEGPCVDCARLSGPGLAYSADLATEVATGQKWPQWGPIAVRAGVGAMLSTALLPTERSPRSTGALNIYSWSPHGLDEADHTTALLLATHASLALAHTQAVEYVDLQATHLRKAIESRDVIGQAKGILMGRRGITADEAFALLRKMSQQLNVKLAELAETLAVRHSELEPLEPPDPE